LTDTAGLDDEGILGKQRVERSFERLSWTDIAILVTALDKAPVDVEANAFEKLSKAGTHLFVVGSFADKERNEAKKKWLSELAEGRFTKAPYEIIEASGLNGSGIDRIKAALGSLRSKAEIKVGEGTPLEGLVDHGDIVLLVTPIDSAAPKGRLILPQVETLRDALDRGCTALVARETELSIAYAALSKKPRLVITDSQVFGRVVSEIPETQALTSFSILFARKKGELSLYADGIDAIKRMDLEAKNRRSAAVTVGIKNRPVKLLAIEACTHNRTHEDIATIKIPKLLGERLSREVELSVVRELTSDIVLKDHDLAVVCGGCMSTRTKMMTQLNMLSNAGIPALNFGLFLAWAHGAFPRAVEAVSEG
jgi:[FeFe] hydrogenase H-cluster maturation GTPase HydF